MSVGELYGWSKYLAEEPANSVEIQSALIAQVANNAMGGKATLEDMLITYHKKEESIEEFVAKRPSAQEIKLMFSA